MKISKMIAVILITVLTFFSCQSQRNENNESFNSAKRMTTTEKQFSGIIAFGDGLTDMGQWGVLTDNKYPPVSVGFQDGRWTNGPVWLEHFAKELDLDLSLSNNYAMGGATTGWFNINEPLKPALQLDSTANVLGMLSQIQSHLQKSPSIDKNKLVVLWAGGHDIGNYLDFGFPNLEETPPANNYAKAFEILYNAGARNFVIGNMPDVGSTPLYYGTEHQEEATRLCKDLNSALNDLVLKYETEGCTVYLIDAVSLFTDAAMNPDKYGFKNIVEAYLPYNIIDFSNPLANPSVAIPNKEKGLNPDEFMSWWAVSASAAMHKHIANIAIDLVKPKSE